ncbi:acyl-CoA thioesterase [Agromyces intestinalis]|uniref:Acyl-CoA thioesterase n=1 Tax=Agromyces intestinalis TaxID=2592652 RepID=A0A5C1YGI0_9MICO|nr:acyl-CoA thioesterase [Agromyces intestinalis]QEO14635.1 acyl-CoA thioesterase [Agromyces intestinalis]
MSATYRVEHVVTFAETNLVGNVYFAEYAKWQGICREQFLFDFAPATVESVSSGQLALVTLDCALKFHAEAFAGDVITIEMSLQATSRNRISMTFRYRRDDEVIATGSQSVACLRRTHAGLVPVPIPDDLTAALHTHR